MFTDAARKICWTEVQFLRAEGLPCSAPHHLTAELQEPGQEFLEAERLGRSIHQRHCVDGKAHLERRVLVQVVQHHLRSA